MIDWMISTAMLLFFVTACCACAIGFFAAAFGGQEDGQEKTPSYLRLDNFDADTQSTGSGRLGNSASTLARDHPLDICPSPLRRESIAPRNHALAVRSQFAPSPVPSESQSAPGSAPNSDRPSMVPPLVIPPREAEPETDLEWEVERLRGRIAGGYLLTSFELALLDAIDEAAEKPVAPRQVSHNGRGADAGGRASKDKSPEASRGAARAKRPSSPRMAALSRRTGTSPSHRSQGPSPGSRSGSGSAGKPASHRVQRGAAPTSSWQA